MDRRIAWLSMGWLFAGSALLATSGCKGGGSASGGTMSGDPAMGVVSPGAGLDAVERSRLRETAISALLELSASADPQVRANAVEGLIPAPARLAAVLPGALSDGNVGVRAVGAMSVGKAGVDELLPVVRPLAQDESLYVKAAAIYALRACGEAVDPTPLGLMVTSDRSPQVRAHAAYLLGELRDKGTTSLLREAAQLEVPRASAVEMRVLQVQIAEALVKLGDPSQLHTIRAALYPSTPDEFDATVLAIQVLAGQRDREAQGQLRNLALMRDAGGNPMPVEVRVGVAGALGAMGVAEFEPVAVEAMGEASEPIRIQGAWALGEIATPSAVRVLEGSLRDPVERVRVAVAAALLRALERTGSR